MLVKILLGLGAVIAIILIVAAFQPSTFVVSRTTLIGAPAAAIFPEVNDLHRWLPWSPYEKMDPAMQRTFAGAPVGVGAAYSWVGNNAVGSGKMTIVESRPSDLIRIKLEFYKPMEGVCEATFTFVPENGQTRVTWAMTGKNNYLAKIFCLFMNMDRMVGDQFAAGLASLKTQVEKAAH